MTSTSVFRSDDTGKLLIEKPTTTQDSTVRASMSILQRLLAQYHPRDFTVRLWDGTTWDAEPGQPARFTMVLRHPGALRRMFLSPGEVPLAEAYIYDDFDIEGDIERAFGMAEYLLTSHRTIPERLRVGRQLLSLPANGHARIGRQAAHVRGFRHSRERDRQAVTYHYNVSNDFFALWLDKQMIYSCAYFTTPDDDLDRAQEQKLDYICRKLRLRRGERLLDIGCGWGGLLIHAASKYGVSGYGITLSEPQATLANERIRQAGLTDQCRVEVRDYREMKEQGRFDKLVSVGMFEHVGESMLPEYFTLAWRLLRPGGAFLNHGIASRPFLSLPPTESGQANEPVRQGPPDRGRAGPSFTDRYVFPDGELVPISTTARIAEMTGFEVRDVESLREHYAFTLRHWVRRLEAQHDIAQRITDEVTYRVWRLYMSGSADGFQTGRLNVYQMLLAKTDRGESSLPLTRADWYTGNSKSLTDSSCETKG
jgi:cyclopropane-fatty-acyl-phospholipid synthase